MLFKNVVFAGGHLATWCPSCVNLKRRLCPRQSHHVNFWLRQTRRKIPGGPPSTETVTLSPTTYRSLSTPICASERRREPQVSFRLRRGAGWCTNDTPGHVRSNVAHHPTESVAAEPFQEVRNSGLSITCNETHVQYLSMCQCGSKLLRKNVLCNHDRGHFGCCSATNRRFKKNSTLAEQSNLRGLGGSEERLGILTKFTWSCVSGCRAWMDGAERMDAKLAELAEDWVILYKNSYRHVCSPGLIQYYPILRNNTKQI